MTALPLLLCSLLGAAEATYSIVATDAATRQVGGAGASCVPSGDVYDALYVSVPNRSVLHTQAHPPEHNSNMVTTAVEMMERGESVEDILETMVAMDEGFFTGLPEGFPEYPLVDLRQYGMADLDGNASSHGGYTGKLVGDFYVDVLELQNTEQSDTGMGRNDEDDEESVAGRYSFHAQGNAVSGGTVESLYDGFVGAGASGNDDGCDMAGRLMSAMDMVSGNGLGDMRCVDINPTGIGATSAFLHVDNADGTELVHINVIGDGSFEPMDELRRQFWQWREANPCPRDEGAKPSRLPFNTGGTRVVSSVLIAVVIVANILF